MTSGDAEHQITLSRPSLPRDRHQLSLRDIEELLFERGVVVSYETIRRWCDKFGAGFARRVKAARPKPGTTWHLDEVFVTLRGEPYLLWRDQVQTGVLALICLIE